MGYEPEVPPVPTRGQEIRYINDLAQNYKNQSYTQFYSPEHFRTNKMDLSKRLNQVNRDWYSNFLVGRLF